MVILPASPYYDDIALKGLETRIASGQIKEVILALSPTVEGQTTIHFIQARLKPYDIKISQPAHGIPVGGELEYLDGNTIKDATTYKVVNVQPDNTGVVALALEAQ